MRDRVIAAFVARHGVPPTFVSRAPGRVNLIGEHTDYNDGFVLPIAIDRAAWVAFRPRPDRTIRIQSLDMHDDASLDLDALPASTGHWFDYVAGVAWALDDAHMRVTHGFDGVLAGDVPVGAGLSSSAALELAVARALAHTSSMSWEPTRMARVAQRTENAWIGVNSGIMDQTISAAARPGHALLLDCRSLAMRHVPVPNDVAIVVLDTATRRELVTSAYNERRAQCEAAARYFGVAALRDVDVATFEAKSEGLDDVTRRRARHVVTENARTLAAADALAAGDSARVGTLMDASHVSLRDDFAVSRRELDAIVEIARAQEGVLGARMTGAGFGGCAVALVRRDIADQVAHDVARRYEEQVGLTPAVYITRPSAGAELEVRRS